jgi:hypothetical protein
MLNLAPVETRPPFRQAPAMDALPPPLVFLFLFFSGWVNRLRCRERLGGVLKFYHREAA